jgi:phospholipid/cholesterol/gamma-HCH transport system substrate-binding protein/paraquat-inducible protein B
MKSDAHYFRIGVFVIVVMILLIGGSLLVSSDVFRGDRFLIETYIDESVQGLGVGTSLLHRGVAIGRIEKVTFVPQEYPMDTKSPEFAKFSRYVLLVMSVEKKHFADMGQLPEQVAAMIRQQVNSGLRLKLSYQGITGIAYIEADYMDPERNPALSVPWKPNNIYIPSTKSLITSFTQAVDTVFQRLEKIDFPKIFEQTETTLKSIQTAVDEAKIPELRQSATDMMDQLRQTLSEVESNLKPSDPNVPSVNIADTVAQLDRNLRQIENLISTHQDDVDKILSDIKTITSNLKQLSEQLKADPAQLLQSAPPSKTEIVK